MAATQLSALSFDRSSIVTRITVFQLVEGKLETSIRLEMEFPNIY